LPTGEVGTVIDKDHVILEIVLRDPRYSAEAYDFVFESLDFTLRRRDGAARHVSGSEIMDSVRLLALEQFGYLSRAVLSNWGITCTDDFGDVVFNLIEADLLQKTADDRREDFAHLFDFESAFDETSRSTLAEAEL
jgi:uncharacterized repeat protein (TIGR04138 family)